MKSFFNWLIKFEFGTMLGPFAVWGVASILCKRQREFVVMIGRKQSDYILKMAKSYPVVIKRCTTAGCLFR